MKFLCSCRNHTCTSHRTFSDLHGCSSSDGSACFFSARCEFIVPVLSVPFVAWHSFCRALSRAIVCSTRSLWSCCFRSFSFPQCALSSSMWESYPQQRCWKKQPHPQLHTKPSGALLLVEVVGGIVTTRPHKLNLFGEANRCSAGPRHRLSIKL